MQCAARLGDQVVHTQALPQVKQGWWGGLIKGALIGAAIVAVSAVAVVVTVGTGGLGAPFAIGAAAVVIGSGLRYAQVGFHEGAQAGALQGARAGPIKTGSANVFINGKAAALACLSLAACNQHGDGKQVAQGSATVQINGHRMARVGDGGVCGFVIGEGSPNVFVGAPPASCHGLAVGSEIPQGLSDAVDTAGKIGGYMELVGGFVMGGPAMLNAFKSLAGFASLAAVMGIGYGGSQLASDWAKQHGMSASNQMMFGDFGGLTAALAGGGMIGLGARVFGTTPVVPEGEMVPPADVNANSANAGKRGVTWFDKTGLGYMDKPDAVLGPPGGKAWFMPQEDAQGIKSVADVARETGMAPGAARAYATGGDIYGLDFPQDNVEASLPTAADAGPNPNWLPGGRTAIRIGELGDPNGGYLINQTHEYVMDGGNPPPPGSVLFQLMPDGSLLPLRRF